MSDVEYISTDIGLVAGQEGKPIQLQFDLSCLQSWKVARPFYCLICLQWTFLICLVAPNPISQPANSYITRQDLHGLNWESFATV